MAERSDLEAYPQTNLSNQLLLHHQEMLQFLYFTNYDIVYETFQLKHGSYSDRNRGHLSQTFKSQQIAKHYHSSSQKNHIRILRNDIDLDKQLSKLQVLWHNRNIPYFHRYYFLKYLLTCYMQNVPLIISKEDQLIRSQQHIYYPTFKSINAREACLRNLRKQLADMAAQDVYEYLHIAKERMFNEKRKVQREKYKNQGYKIKQIEETHEGKMGKTKFQLFSDTFNHLTKLTLYSVELILKWKQYIAGVSHDARHAKQRMEYYFYDDNYFLKILNDLGFIKVSFVQQFYQFAPKNDPFLLHCVLSFQKKPEKTIQHQLLKHIFMPQKEHLAQIMNKLELLSQQYRNNIRSRKVFDLNVLKQPIVRAQQKLFNNEASENISNLVLKKIESPMISKKSKSLATFRVRGGSSSVKKKDKIIIQFKQSPLKKKLLNLPGSLEKTMIQSDNNSPLKNSIILQKNESAVNLNTIDENLLNMLKREVIKRVKQQFQLNKGAKNHENQALELLIDNKVKETMRNIFPFEPQKQLKQSVQFFPLSVKQINLSAEIDLMFKQSYNEYKQMQINQIDLTRLLNQAEYAYILVAKLGQQEIGRIICALEKQVFEFKVLKILYLHFVDISEMQLLVLKFVEFLWQYENSFEVHYVFYQPANNEPIRLLIQGIEKTLQKECLFGRKQVYSTVTEVKLVFKRKHKNINYFPNKHPFSFNLQFNLLFSNKKLMLENKSQHKHLQLLNYDYLLMHALKRFVTSQQILTLKQKVSWKNRLRILVEMVKEEEQNDLMIDQLVQLQAQNVSQLNSKLTKLKRPFMEISDIVKANTINLLSLKLFLTPRYPMKSLHHINHQQYYRISIMTQFSIEIDEAGTQFIFLKTKESQNFCLMFFDAKQYLKSSKHTELSLNQYLMERISKRQHGIKKVQISLGCLWVPMARHPHKYKEREDMFYPTVRVLDLASLKYDILLGQKMEWNCSMQMDNSILFQQHPSDIVLNMPLGIGVVANKPKTVIYTRIVI